MNILFSEHESYYRDLGLVDIEDVKYTFNGAKYYRRDCDFIKQFDAFVCAFYTMPHNVLLTIKFKSLNIPTIICTDGVFDFANSSKNPMVTKFGAIMYRPILQEYFLCVGKKEAKYFSNQAKTVQYLPKRVLNAMELIPVPRKRRVLLTTANSAYFDEVEFDLLLSLLVDIIDVLVAAEVDFNLRIFDSKLLSALTHQCSTDIYNDVETDFEKTLQRYSNVITTPSSIAIPAMYHQRAVGTLIYRDEPLFLQTGWQFTSKSVFSNALKSFLSLNGQRIDFQNHIVNEYAVSEGITDKLSEIISAESNNKKLQEQYINRSMYNMLNSSFNFNFEYAVRKVYLKLRTLYIFKYFKFFRQLLK